MRAAARASGCSSCCASTSRTSCRSARAHTAAPRRRRPGPRPQRRGLPRARLLGRALRLSRSSTSGCPRSRAGCSCTATAGSARRARRRAKPATGARCTRGRAAATARRRPSSCTSTRSRALGAGPQPQPAPRQRGDLLQRLALLPGHRRPRLPARLRRGDDARDRALLGIDRPLQPRAGAVRDPRRDGPGRVPREVPGRRGGGPAQQRLHQRDGGLDLRDRAERCSTCCPRAARDALRAKIGLRDEEIAAWQEHEPQDVRALPRATASSASSRATRTWRSSTGTPTARSTATSSGSTGSCVRRATIPTATRWPSRPTP